MFASVVYVELHPSQKLDSCHRAVIYYD